MTTGQVFKNTIIVLLTLVAAYALLVSLHIIIVLLLAIIIASALRPFVTSLVRRHVPIGIAIVLIYLVLAFFIFLIGVAVIPPVVNQLVGYLENEVRLAYRIIMAQRWVEHLISDVTRSEVSLVDPDDIRLAVSEFMVQLRAVMPSMVDDIGSTIGEAVLIFVMGAYWLTSHKKATAFITQLSPAKYRDEVMKVIDEIEATMGGYVRGMVIISTIVGLLNFSAMQLLGIPNAATIGFMIAVTTTIPMIGGAIGAILAILMTLVVAPEYVVTVFIITFIVQQIEAYILGPRVMSEHVGLDPLLVIVYTSVGFVMFGILGALIAVPVMGTIHILLLHLVIEPYKRSLQQFQTQEGLPVIRKEQEIQPATPAKVSSPNGGR